VAPNDHEETHRLLRNLYKQASKKPQHKIDAYRSSAKRELNKEIDLRDKDSPLDFDFIQKLPEVVFNTEKREKEEDNPNDPELYEKNELTDWERPKTQEDLEAQDISIRQGVTLLNALQSEYQKKFELKTSRTPKSDDLPNTQRVQQRDGSHAVVSPEMLTRYGQGNTLLIYQLNQEHGTKFSSLVDHCYNTLKGMPNFPKSLSSEAVLIGSKQGFWVEDKDDTFLAGEQFSIFHLMLNPIYNVKNHPLIDEIDITIGKQHDQIYHKHIVESNPAENFYEFTIFRIEETTNKETITQSKPQDRLLFLLLIFRYTNVINYSITEKSKPRRKNEEEEGDNNKILIQYLFFRLM